MSHHCRPQNLRVHLSATERIKGSGNEIGCFDIDLNVLITEPRRLRREYINYNITLPKQTIVGLRVNLEVVTRLDMLKVTREVTKV